VAQPDHTAADLAAAEALLTELMRTISQPKPRDITTDPPRTIAVAAPPEWSGLIAAALARRADEARSEERQALCLAAPAAEREAVGRALLKVARNVVKHCEIRSGWHEGDECFQLDLLAAEAELLAMADRARREGVAEGREEGCAFAVGDGVQKVGGDYQFVGVVRSVFRKASGAVRLVVEDDRGILHVFSEKSLAALPPTEKPDE
jgi:hypothetical protein